MKLVQSFVFCFLFSLSMHGQGPGADSSTKTDSGKTPKTAPVRKTENPAAVIQEKEENSTITLPADDFTNWSRLIAIIGLLAIMAWTIIHIFGYVKTSQVFIGHNTIKLIGFVLLLPSICIVSIISPTIIGGAVLATLLGTIAGYVLSRNQEENETMRNHLSGDASKKNNPLKEIEALKAQVDQLTKENAELKAKSA